MARTNVLRERMRAFVNDHGRSADLEGRITLQFAYEYIKEPLQDQSLHPWYCGSEVSERTRRIDVNLTLSVEGKRFLVAN
jgi:hypothetical protein